jgi:hypothetical protein
LKITNKILLKDLYNGFVFQTLIAGPGCGIYFITYEANKDFFKSFKHSKFEVI